MKKWIITCNPKLYDVVGAFEAHKRLNWKQSVNIQVGDIVYIYVGAPYSAIMYETKVLSVDQPTIKINDEEFVIDGTNFEQYGRYMELELIQKFDQNLLVLSKLKAQGLKSVQGPSRVNPELDKYINEMKNKYSTKNNRNYFFVFQNKSFDEEYNGGYLWSPQQNKSGRKIPHWEQMKNVKKGDLIIHSYTKEIIAFSVAKTDVYEANRPANTGVHDEWDP